ncbi:MAG: glycosyltransferase family 4 protein [Patescibacteria group bacterium]
MKPRIVILSAFLTPFRSGAEACAEEVPLALKDQYDFTIVTARLKKSLPKKDMLQGAIPVVRIGFGFGFDKWLFPFLAPLAVRKLKPVVAHAVLETFAGLALVFCKWMTSAKRILTMQTTNRSFLKKMIVRSPDKVTAISSVLVDMAEKFGRDDVIKIPNGIPVAAIHESLIRNPKIPGRILFVGRLEPQKGVDVLLKAFSILADGATLRIVGDGSQRNRLEKMANDLGISDHVKFTGYIPADQIHCEYAQAEIFCGLSRHEAFGNVFLEAQAAGCAVIGTNIEGILDIVKDGETGILVDPDDPGAASLVLAKLLADSDLRNRLSEAGKLHAQSFDWSCVAMEYAKVYEKAISS